YSRLPSRSRDNAVAVAQLCVDIAEHLSDLFEFPELDVPDLSEFAAKRPREAARILRDDWSLGQGPIRNVVHLLEKHGVRVFSVSDDVADVDAFCFWSGGQAFVVLNLRKSGERGRFDGCHELAHLVLHRHIDFRTRDVEKEADT